jgi:hypothetical protein
MATEVVQSVPQGDATMPKRAQNNREPKAQPKFQRGDRVHRDGTKGVWCIDWISEDGRFANLSMETADLKWPHFPTERLTRA